VVWMNHDIDHAVSDKHPMQLKAAIPSLVAGPDISSVKIFPINDRTASPVGPSRHRFTTSPALTQLATKNARCTFIPM
jgi:hypothetical protein